MMNLKNIAMIFFGGVFAFGCNQQNEPSLTEQAGSQSTIIFPKGDQITNNNFTGNVFLHPMVEADSINQNAVGSVTFEPGARSNWHSHPAGQIIIAIDGEGYYQEKGQPREILRKGDTRKCPPNIPHWHGASADHAFIQIAITGRERGPVVWMEPVTEEYND